MTVVESNCINQKVIDPNSFSWYTVWTSATCNCTVQRKFVKL